MVSILIPTYNYNVMPLVKTLSEQAEVLAIDYEILIWDDASNEVFLDNEALPFLPKTLYHRSAHNGGRTYTRQQLALKARFNTLLFLDADVMPVSSLFLKNYLDQEEESDLYIGGILYFPDPPTPDKHLRWTYGKNREAKMAADRERHPYFVTSPNIWIRKDLFLTINPSLDNRYGMDHVFSYHLKKRGTKVRHIDNPVYHLGLEENSVFLSKSIRALETLIDQESKGKIAIDFTSLQKAYMKLNQWHLASLFAATMRPFIKKLEKNLLSAKPNLFYFDLYKLYHYTRMKL